MSAIANKRRFLEAAQELVKAREPTQEQIELTIIMLSKIVTDVCGQSVVLMPFTPEDDTIKLTEEDTRLLLNLLENPPEPNEALKRAFERHQMLINNTEK